MLNIDYITLFSLSLLSTVVSTPLVIKAAFKTDFLDHPEGNPLKIHSNPIPVLGGAAIVLGILLSLSFSILKFDSLRPHLIAIAIALSVIFFIGLWDDKKSLKPLFRLLGQFIVASFFVIFLNPDALFDFGRDLFYCLISIFCIVLCINALNFLDGIDGLASGITFVASIGFLGGFLFLGNVLGSIISLTLVGSSLGFLFFNFNPAKIFLGDNGSTVLGFLLGVLLVLFTSYSKTISNFLFPFLVLIIPIGEIILVVCRRTRNRIPFFQGDRNHSYDTLLRKGFTQKQTTLLICVFGLASSVVGLGLLWTR